MIYDQIHPEGKVEIVKEWKDQKREVLWVPNTVLFSGRRALVSCLANQLDGTFSFYISRMIFGDGGTQGEIKRYVNPNRDGLFGVTRLSKPVMSNVDGSVPTQVIFISVIRYEDAVGVTLNEMALQMANERLFSMTTFPNLQKTEDMQITFNWYIAFV